MDVVLLHNEKAGSYSWSRKELIRLLRREGFNPTYHPIKQALARPELMEAGEFVVVAGGDGAVRKVSLALIGRKRPIAPLPLGTANNICRSLGLRPKIEKIVAGWRKPRRVKFDVGVAAGPWGHRHFVEGVGVGLIGRIIAVLTEVDEVSVHEWKNARHKLHRDACVAAVIAHEMQPLPVELTLDGRDAANDFLLVEVLNIRQAGPAIQLAPDARPSDGRFDVVTVTAGQRGRLLHTLKARLADAEHIRNLTTRHARTVKLRCKRDCEIRIDDGTVALPANESVTLTVEKDAVEFLLPK